MSCHWWISLSILYGQVGIATSCLAAVCGLSLSSLVESAVLLLGVREELLVPGVSPMNLFSTCQTLTQRLFY